MRKFNKILMIMLLVLGVFSYNYSDYAVNAKVQVKNSSKCKLSSEKSKRKNIRKVKSYKKTPKVKRVTRKPSKSSEKFKEELKKTKLFYDIKSIPEFDGNTPFVVLNNNIPDFSKEGKLPNRYEVYSELDSKNRVGEAVALLGLDTMPTEKRGKIGMVKPSGWQTIKFDIVDGRYLYNRSHLIGFQLAGENANKKNLMTGTRYFNVTGMLPFENMVADYIKETKNHVMYKITPIFKDNELVARGIIMQAKSVEDNGEGISFNVYVYNNQPGITIDYKTGKAVLSK